MTHQQVLEALIEVAGQLEVAVRVEKGNFRGGQCLVEGNQVVLLNKRHPPEVNVAILSQCLQKLPVDSVYMRPAVREAFEKHVDTPTAVSADDAPASS